MPIFFIFLLLLLVELVLQDAAAGLQLPQILELLAAHYMRQRDVAHHLLIEQPMDELVHVGELPSLGGPIRNLAVVVV
jgi:hypothetical protein